MTKHSLLDAGRLVVASHNEGKVREIRALLEPFGIVTVSAGELGLDEPEETGKTFVANARLKADAAAQAAGIPSLADDSGLVVDALDGEPGIYSARWAGEARSFSTAMKAVEAKLRQAGAETPASRSAHFVCVLCLSWPDGYWDAFEGRVDGNLVWPPRGDRGFGYDPIFCPNGHDLTFGEMDPGAKHAMSHRAQAFQQMVEYCIENQDRHSD